MKVSAKVDYALRASAELAAHESEDKLLTSEQIAERQGIPHAFLTNILQSLRQAGLVTSKRGPVGGHKLARPANAIAVADVIRAIDGPLVGVQGQRPERLEFAGAAKPLESVWIAVRANLREILEHVTLEDVANDDLPKIVDKRAANKDAWVSR